MGDILTAGRSNAQSLSLDWGTPTHYVTAVRTALGGTIWLDPCSNRFSVVGARVEFLLPNQDGLVEAWDYPTVYSNPPYGADRDRGTSIKNWLAKCAEAHSRYEAEVIALVPVATNTSHWKEYVWPSAASICFLYDTRLKFLENGSPSKKGAPMACSMVYWGGHRERFGEVFKSYGAVR